MQSLLHGEAFLSTTNNWRSMLMRFHAKYTANSSVNSPDEGVGLWQTLHFVEQHSDKQHQYWSHALDNAWAWAVNPVTNDAYYRLLSDTWEETGNDNEIPGELVYTTDKTGIQGGIGSKERVIGLKGQHTQHWQWSGTWENITVTVLYCYHLCWWYKHSTCCYFQSWRISSGLETD